MRVYRSDGNSVKFVVHENHGLIPLNSLRTSVPTTLKLDGKGPRFDAAHSEKVSFPH